MLAATRTRPAARRCRRRRRGGRSARRSTTRNSSVVWADRAGPTSPTRLLRNSLSSSARRPWWRASDSRPVSSARRASSASSRRRFSASRSLRPRSVSGRLHGPRPGRLHGGAGARRARPPPPLCAAESKPTAGLLRAGSASSADAASSARRSAATSTGEAPGPGQPFGEPERLVPRGLAPRGRLRAERRGPRGRFHHHPRRSGRRPRRRAASARSVPGGLLGLHAGGRRPSARAPATWVASASTARCSAATCSARATSSSVAACRQPASASATARSRGRQHLFEAAPEFLAAQRARRVGIQPGGGLPLGDGGARLARPQPGGSRPRTRPGPPLLPGPARRPPHRRSRGQRTRHRGVLGFRRPLGLGHRRRAASTISSARRRAAGRFQGGRPGFELARRCAASSRP